MCEILKQNWILILAFTAILTFGFLINRPLTNNPAKRNVIAVASQESATTLTPSDCITCDPCEPICNPCSMSEQIAETMNETVERSADGPVDFFTLLPETNPVPVMDNCAPQVTQNGDANGRAKETEEKPTTIKTLPPDVPLTEDAKSAAPPGKTAESKKNCPEWIPFVYYYQQSMTQFGPVKTLSIYPVDPTVTCPAPCPASIIPVYPVMPVMPVYPMTQKPVVPVYAPEVRSSHFGAPKLVYPNGVVIKPKVYYPNQKLRNVLRAVTP